MSLENKRVFRNHYYNKCYPMKFRRWTDSLFTSGRRRSSTSAVRSKRLRSLRSRRCSRSMRKPARRSPTSPRRRRIGRFPVDFNNYRPQFLDLVEKVEKYSKDLQRHTRAIASALAEHIKSNGEQVRFWRSQRDRIRDYLRSIGLSLGVAKVYADIVHGLFLPSCRCGHRHRVLVSDA